MRSLIVRAPNHLGDLLLALPAIESLQPAAVLLPRWLLPVLELAALPGEAIPFDRGTAGLLAAARELRRRRFTRGVLLAPSFSAALLFALGGVRERRGARTDGRGFLITEAVPDQGMRGLHRSATYHVLATGTVPEPLPAPVVRVPERLRREWEELLGAAGPWRRDGESGMGRWGDGAKPASPAAAAPTASSAPGHRAGLAAPAETESSHRPIAPSGLTLGLFPGSNAPSRRWETARFAELARRQVAAGARVVVFGGAGERAITREVAGDVAFDAGGRTELPLLAAGLASCDLLVTNDSGPMHLAAAVGTPTVSLQGPSDPVRTRPLGAGHVLVRHAELPCISCVRNECPRRGHGTVLAEARQECLQLITVDEVEVAVGAAAGARH